MANQNLVDGTYEVRHSLGAGNFGEIRLCKDVKTGKAYAIKMENMKARSPQLHYEYEFYKILCPQEGIPNAYFYGVHCNLNVMVMDLLGPSLENHFNACGRSFSVKKVALIAIQLFPLMSYVHSKGIIYRDVKPENFLLGLGRKEKMVHIVDFGLSKMYRDLKTGVHIPLRDHKNLTGTARYMSINTHKGIEQSRRDDLEAICHMIFYFLRGSLPWQGLQANNLKDRYHNICQKKMATSIGDLCRNFPQQFGDILAYSRKLEFTQDPDYDYFNRQMLDVMSPLSDEGDDDWAAHGGTDLRASYNGNVESRIGPPKSKWKSFLKLFKKNKFK